jgi:hypothetical protein
MILAVTVLHFRLHLALSVSSIDYFAMPTHDVVHLAAVVDSSTWLHPLALLGNGVVMQTATKFDIPNIQKNERLPVFGTDRGFHPVAAHPKYI